MLKSPISGGLKTTVYQNNNSSKKSVESSQSFGQVSSSSPTLGSTKPKVNSSLPTPSSAPLSSNSIITPKPSVVKSDSTIMKDKAKDKKPTQEKIDILSNLVSISSSSSSSTSSSNSSVSTSKVDEKQVSSKPSSSSSSASSSNTSVSTASTSTPPKSWSSLAAQKPSPEQIKAQKQQEILKAKIDKELEKCNLSHLFSKSGDSITLDVKGTSYKATYREGSPTVSFYQSDKSKIHFTIGDNSKSGLAANEAIHQKEYMGFHISIPTGGKKTNGDPENRHLHFSPQGYISNGGRNTIVGKDQEEYIQLGKDIAVAISDKFREVITKKFSSSSSSSSPSSSTSSVSTSKVDEKQSSTKSLAERLKK